MLPGFFKEKLHMRYNYQRTYRTPIIIELEKKDGTVLKIKAIKTYSLPQECVVIKGLRGRENLTQKQLALLLGISVTSLSRIERGLKDISDRMKEKLAKALNTHTKMFNKK